MRRIEEYKVELTSSDLVSDNAVTIFKTKSLILYTPDFRSSKIKPNEFISFNPYQDMKSKAFRLQNVV